MSGRRGKRAAVVGAAVTFVVLLVGVCGLRGWIEETWNISRLRSSNESERLHAADRLGEMRSFRAVERLIDAIRSDPREGVRTFGSAAGQESGGGWVELTPMAHALYRAGPGALRVLERAEARCNSAREAGSSAEWGVSSVLSIIRDLWSHPEMPARRRGYPE